MAIKKVSNLNIKGKRILMRIDINSSVIKGKVQDSPRLKENAKIIKNMLSKKAILVLIAHQGRKGDRDFTSLQRHAELLSKHSGKKIKYVDYLFESKGINEILKLKEGECILMKNVRFYDDEKNLENNRYGEFSKNFDIFVNDAFSVSHRKQSSIVVPPKYIPAYMGLGMEKELNSLNKLKMGNKGTSYLIGGTKIDDYIPIFDNLKNKRNKVLASGVLANILLVANGNDLGYENKWLKEKGYMGNLPMLKRLLNKYRNQIILPVDVAVSVKGKRKEIGIIETPTQYKIFDVGKETVSIFKKEIEKSSAVFMKGPLGFSEMKEFSNSTVEILREISILSKKKKLYSLLSGGHLVTTADKHGIKNNFSYVSMSGGALISYISGNKLPGIEALRK